MTTPVGAQTGGTTHRLFFALWPDDTTRESIAAAAATLRADFPAGRWIPAARYHLTLQFLGTFAALPAALIDSACAAAARVRAPEAVINLDRIGSFPRRPRLWWMGSRHPEALLPLWESLTNELVGQGVEVGSTPLIPHVTLVRGADRAPPDDIQVLPLVWSARHFALIHSGTGVDTSYEVLRQWPLQGAVGPLPHKG